MIPVIKHGAGQNAAYGIRSDISSIGLIRPGTGGSVGDWVSIGTASATLEAFCLILYATGSQDDAIVVDVGTGPDGSQVAIVEKVKNNQDRTGGATSGVQFIPVRIPAGSEIWVRGEAEADDAFFQASLQGYRYSFVPSYSRLVSMGYPGFANAKGTQVLPGGSAHTKGSWTEIESSTPYTFRGLMLSAGGGVGFTDATYLVDIAVGASGSEQVIVSNLLFRMFVGGDTELEPFFTPVMPVSVKKGERLSVRCQRSTLAGNNDDDGIDVILQGLV